MANISYTRQSGSLGNWLSYHFMEKKMNTIPGYIIMLLLGSAITFAMFMTDYRIAFFVAAIVACILLVIAFLKYPYFGLYFTIAYSSIVITLMRLVDLPFGIFVDPMTVLILLGAVLNYDRSREINKEFWSNPVSICFYILFAYSVVELFNPAMYSKLGWISFFRKQVSFYIYYLSCYCLLNSKKKIIFFVNFMIGLSTLLALYACKQQLFGYANFEMLAIMKGGPLAYQLLFQGGLLRKFSTFSDPATSGIVFASSAMFCIILLVRDSNRSRKIWWAIAGTLNILGYSFSGTRTATLMIVAAIAFYSIATLYERATLRFMFISILVFYAVLVVPSQNVVTNRIRTAFDGTRDASASLRDYDRHQIQPYLFEHPMGGGIFTSGAEGPKYNPGHPLEMFQPDSGYAKVLAEQGAIGLALLLLTYLIVMRQGIRNFYRAKDPEIQNYYIGLLAMLFSILVGQYSQMAISQYPILLYYYGLLVIFYKLIKYDSPQPDVEISQN